MSLKGRVLPAVLVVCLVCLVTKAAATAWIDSPAPNRPYEAASRSGRFVIRMQPASDWGEKGSGSAFERTKQGEKPLWAVQWFAQHVELSDTGEHLVRYGPWASDQENHTDLAVAFYRKGQHLKSYKVRDLLKNRAAASNSVSHYRWHAERQSVPNGFEPDGIYHLVVADKFAYRFDLNTGEIRERYVDPEARSMREVWEEERAAARQSGLRLYEASPLKARLEAHFKVDDIEAGNGKMYSVHFEEPEWRASLVPLRHLGQRCEVEAVFPINDDGRIAAEVEPEEILAAFGKGLSHPFVSERFRKGGASGLRLRITGDRLHWNTKELQEYLQALDHPDTKVDELRHWAYLIIDAVEPRYTSVYVNVRSGELIYRDDSMSPPRPSLLRPDAMADH